MEPDCRKIAKEILPAVRASISEIMDSEYHYKQADIASKLDIAQVAVSKYLNKRYSKRVKHFKDYIDRKDMVRPLVKHMLKEDRSEIDVEINRLCTEICSAAMQ